MRRTPEVIAFGMMVLLSACRTSPTNTAGTPGSPDQSPGTATADTVSLVLGEQVVVTPALTLRFERVVADSRCPQQVTCVWAGSVRVRLLATTPRGTQSTVDLESNLEPRSAVVNGVRVRLLPEIAPAAGTQGAYRIRLVVDRVNP